MTRRKIKDFPMYEACTDGTIFSCVKGECKRLKPYTTDQGYKRIGIGQGKKRRLVFVHRLILETFIGKASQGQICCHQNGRPGDNRLENLKWGTPQQNSADSVRHKTAYMRRGQKHPNALLTEKQVRVIKHCLLEGMTPWSLRKYFPCTTRASIYQIRKGKSWGWLKVRHIGSGN